MVHLSPARRPAGSARGGLAIAVAVVLLALAPLAVVWVVPLVREIRRRTGLRGSSSTPT